jgi:hypothetical protein
MRDDGDGARPGPSYDATDVGVPKRPRPTVSASHRGDPLNIHDGGAEHTEEPGWVTMPTTIATS